MNIFKFPLFLLSIVLGSTCSFAYDIEIDGIYYDILSSASVEVTSGTNKYSESVVIPSSVTCNGISYVVTSIGKFAFYNCRELSSIEIPNSVTSIGKSAFNDCKGLTSVVIPNSVTSIEENVFQYCSGLISVEIPNSVTYIGDNAFSGCSSLYSLEIPKSLTSIGERVFSSCISLTTVEIPNSVTSIGNSAFSGCSSLTNVEIPNSVTSIGNNAFEFCDGLATVNLPSSLTHIGYAAFAVCRSLEFIEIPSSLTYIADNVFSTCTSLTSVIIPESITSIGNSAFFNCPALTSLSIPNSVTSIGDDAFNYCSGLTSVKIPSSVTSIGKLAFYNCNLTELWVSWINPGGLIIGDNAFASTYNITLYVLMGTKEDYKYRSPWNNFREIKEYLPGGNEGNDKCGLPVVTVENGKLVFNSSTADAKFYYSIKCDDEHPLTNTDDGIVELNGTYQISVYAYADGYDNSDVTTATLVWITPELEDAGIVSMEAQKALLIKNMGSKIQICGTEYGEIIELYTIDGMLLCLAKGTDGETIIPHSLQKGEIYIIKYGNKAITYKY